MTHHPFDRSIILLAAILLSGCTSVYYNTMEAVGKPKRDLLTGRVETARDSQQEAKEEFQDALTAFSAVVNMDGGELEKTYNTLNKAFERCESRAVDVRDRIAAIDSVARALFKEWSQELKTYTNPELKRASEKQLRATEAQYKQMLAKMNAAAASMDPVLAAFRDQVLFLKHNLNSQAIASIQTETDKIQADVSRLIRDMEVSIAEADAFIKQMETP